MVVDDLRRLRSAGVDVKGSPAVATRGDGVFAWNLTNKKLLFADLKRLVVALAFFVKKNLSSLDLMVVSSLSS